MLEFTGKVINGQISWTTEANWIQERKEAAIVEHGALSCGWGGAG